MIYRAYLTSTSAHNMVTVDNKTYNAKKLEPGNAGIEYYDVNNDKPYDYVVGIIILMMVLNLRGI